MFDSADVDLLLQSFEEDAYPSDDTVKYLVAVTNLRRRFFRRVWESVPNFTP